MWTNTTALIRLQCHTRLQPPPRPAREPRLQHGQFFFSSVNATPQPYRNAAIRVTEGLEKEAMCEGW